MQLREFEDVGALVQRLGLDGEGPQPVDWLTPGTVAARSHFNRFLDRIADYDDDRNRYATADTSKMSPYLHFGQISPVWIAHQLRRHTSDASGRVPRGADRPA